MQRRLERETDLEQDYFFASPRNLKKLKNAIPANVTGIRRQFHFFAASIAHATGSIQSGLASVRIVGRNAASIIS
jgi:hypothetical protein